MSTAVWVSWARTEAARAFPYTMLSVAVILCERRWRESCPSLPCLGDGGSRCSSWPRRAPCWTWQWRPRSRRVGRGNEQGVGDPPPRAGTHGGGMVGRRRSETRMAGWHDGGSGGRPARGLWWWQPGRL